MLLSDRFLVPGHVARGEREQRVRAAEEAREVLRRGLSDVPDRERVEHAGQTAPLRLL